MRWIAACTAALALGLAPAHASPDPGVGDESLHVGVHLQATGAAPVPVAPVVAGMEMYWAYQHDVLGALVGGRRVEVHVLNDGGSPSAAVSACNELAQSTLVLMGFSGSQQIHPCAAYAQDQGIPYLYLGQGIEPAKNGTAFSMVATYGGQAPIIASYIANELGPDVDRYGRVPMRLPILDLELPLLTEEGPDGVVRVGLVRRGVPEADAAEEALVPALAEHALEMRTYVTVQEGSGGDADRIAREMRADGIDVVVTETPAVFTALLINRSAQDGYRPHWLALGVTSGLNRLADVVCHNDPAMSAFSPWPAWDAVRAGAFDTSFGEASALFSPQHDDPTDGDVMLAGWGMMKWLHPILDAAGPGPARAPILAMLGDGLTVDTGLFPAAAYSAEDHAGIDAIHRLDIACHHEGGTQFIQGDSFVTGY